MENSSRSLQKCISVYVSKNLGRIIVPLTVIEFYEGLWFGNLGRIIVPLTVIEFYEGLWFGNFLS